MTKQFTIYLRSVQFNSWIDIGTSRQRESEWTDLENIICYLLLIVRGCSSTISFHLLFLLTVALLQQLHAIECDVRFILYLLQDHRRRSLYSIESGFRCCTAGRFTRCGGSFRRIGQWAINIAQTSFQRAHPFLPRGTFHGRRRWGWWHKRTRWHINLSLRIINISLRVSNKKFISKIIMIFNVKLVVQNTESRAWA